MKKNRRLSNIIFVIIIAFVCIACEQQLDNREYLKIEKWNGFEFRQRAEVSDNQYNIAVNKIKTVFNSDSFTDNEREKIKSKIDIIVIIGIGAGSGGLGGGYGTADYFLINLLCNSIQDEIEECFRIILRW